MQEPELPDSSGIYCSEMDFTATGRYEGSVALSVQPALWRTFQAPEWEDETDDKSGSHSGATQDRESGDHTTTTAKSQSRDKSHYETLQHIFRIHKRKILL